MTAPTLNTIASIQGDELLALIETIGDEEVRFRVLTMALTGDDSALVSSDMEVLSVAVSVWLSRTVN